MVYDPNVMSVESTTTLRLRVSQKAESILRSGHPWLFSDSIREQNRDGQAAAISPSSMIARTNSSASASSTPKDRSASACCTSANHKNWIVCGGNNTSPKPSTDAAISSIPKPTAIASAMAKMTAGRALSWTAMTQPSSSKIYTTAWLPRLEEIVDIIGKQVPNDRIILRLSRNIQDKSAPYTEGQIVRGKPLLEPIIFLESGLRFEVDVIRGQKTGFYLDQRDNRRLVESLSQGCRVLNVFSFSGGFSLYAARGGAVSVTDLDISPHALTAANRNFELNLGQPAIAGCHHGTVKADAFDWLDSAPPASFDLIILDPPSLAKRETEREQAIGAYARLTRSAIKLLQSGGILVACSCSAHVSTEEFLGSVREAATQSTRTFKELQTTAQPPDHPATYPEAHYLKAIYLRL